MIEICKILTGKYDIVIRYDLRKFFFLLKELSTFGTVCLIMLCMLNLLTYLKQTG